MKPLIDFDECLRDSPKFRYNTNESFCFVDCYQVFNVRESNYKTFNSSREQLETEEACIDSLEIKLDKVLKTCSAMIDSGKIYMNQRGYVLIIIRFVQYLTYIGIQSV